MRTDRTPLDVLTAMINTGEADAEWCGMPPSERVPGSTTS